MEFLLYLSPESHKIYTLISQKVKVVENAPICRKHDIFGWYQSNKKLITICTDRIKDFQNFEKYVNETINHESVHVAHECKSNNGTMIPFGISPDTMHLDDRRKTDLNSSIRINGETNRRIEHEALWMEDKPDKVEYVLKKYCF
jgi:hypothetical protein